MSLPFDITNGASLEDCHTNFIALVDLTGIKWRRLYVDSVYMDPTQDPVLKSYSNCLSAGIYSVWRKVPKGGVHQSPQESQSWSCFKELWIFWYKVEPDLTGLIEPYLTEAERGSWENGLSYECRTLFFKALQNLIERCLISQGYAKIGKFFVKPQALPVSRENRTQMAFALEYFIHGDCTVCASIDERTVPSVYILDKCHINAAQVGQKNIKVILSPFGMQGKLTGVGYKYSDPHMAKFLNEWHMFYIHPHGRAKCKLNSEVPSVVEVLVGSILMKYPSSYVFVTLEDHTDAFPIRETSLLKDFTLPAKQPRTKSNHLPAPGLLTPPMSPAENCALGDISRCSQSVSATALLKSLDNNTIAESSEIDYSNLIIRSVCQESYVLGASEKCEDGSMLWDFHDPTLSIKCGCKFCSSTLSKLKPGHSMNLPSEYGLHTGNLKNRKTSSKVAFHRRSIAFNRPGHSQPQPKNNETTDLRPSGTNLPQLQTPFNLLKRFSVPANASRDPPFSQQSTLDPVMPTLSPQTPVVKEEPFFQIEETSGQVHMLGGGQVSPEPVTLKGKISDEILSPFHTSLLNSFENAKLFNKKSLDSIGDTDTVFITTNACQSLEKPELSKRTHEECNEPELTMSGLLYDYRHLDKSPLWQTTGLKKRRLSSLVLAKEESNESDCDIVSSYELDETVPSIPKDPYEFTEFDETAPSERGFSRQKMEFMSKDEKFLSLGMPTTTAMPTIPQPLESNLNEDPDKASSPSGTKNFCPKFIREEDLAVSLHDLDNIFDTSSSETEDNADGPVTPSKLIAFDDFSVKIELSRMYPTPPSLEHHAVPSPFGPLIGSDTIISEADTFKDDMEVDHSSTIMGYDQEYTDVWYPPLLTEFVESSRYAALSSLPYTDYKLDQNLVFKSQWTHPTLKHSYNSPEEDIQMLERPQVYSQHGSYDEDSSCHLYSQESVPSFPMSNCDIVSPASSIPSYFNKNLNSIDNNMPQSIIEINPLLVNLLLSDSLLNVFKDHNFDCCCFCACNQNVKGSDVDTILPNTLVPTYNDEAQYKCHCGFSAVIHRHKSYNSGLFYEDELEVTGSVCCSSNRSGESPKFTFQLDNVPGFVLDLLRIQCKTLSSPFSLFYKFRLSAQVEERLIVNAIEMSDAQEICFLALEEAKMCTDNLMPSKYDDSWKLSCLHKWSYVSSPLPSSNQDVRLHLESLKPLFQTAVHKKNTQCLWDVTYVVTGPLTWREFLRLTSRGSEDQCEPQPIPSIQMGNNKDSIAISPFSLKLWDKLSLEPHSLPRDIAYIVVVPEDNVVLSTVKHFFQELSSTYEAHQLGKHRPIEKALRDGIMRVGKKAASKVEKEPIHEWFNTIEGGQVANKLKLYARVCKHWLAPHLSLLPLDNSIFQPITPKSPSSVSGNSPASSETCEKSPSHKHGDYESGETKGSPETAEEECHNVPALVIYIVEPFTFSSCDPDLYRLVSLGIMYAYADMLSILPEATRNAIHLQILSLDSIMCHGSSKPKLKPNREVMKHHKDRLKSLSLSVYSQSFHSSTHQLEVKSLNGFGPAAAQDKFVKNKNSKAHYPINVFNQPFVIASVKDKQTQLGELFGDRREKCGVLYCSYCLTKDKKYLIASCTNDNGEMMETTVINIGIPNRQRRKQASVRKFGLRKLLDFILEILSLSVHPWRLVIDRFGRMGHGELRAWASLLSKKSLQYYSKYLREVCNQCSISGIGDGPSILSACLVSLGPDSTLRIMSDQFTMNDRFSGSRNKTCHLSTPEDATCTHILVFPTSATTQCSQATFHQEQDHIDPLPGGLGEDLFEAMGEDLPATDLNDILTRWSDSPPPEGNSPRRDTMSQPSSPCAPFRSSVTSEQKYDSILNESEDDVMPILQQPLALGYYVSTAKTGTLPKWFWASCPHMENKLPVFLKSALLIHLPLIQQSSDDFIHNSNQQPMVGHPLDSNLTTDVLRYVLEGYNALSWLQLDAKYNDRRSCLPIHMQILMQLYGIVETVL